MIYSKGQQLFMYYFKEKFFKNTTCKEYVRFTEKRPSHATLIGKIPLLVIVYLRRLL